MKPSASSKGSVFTKELAPLGGGVPLRFDSKEKKADLFAEWTFSERVFQNSNRF
jgi:hypothetical protein